LRRLCNCNTYWPVLGKVHNTPLGNKIGWAGNWSFGIATSIVAQARCHATDLASQWNFLVPVPQKHTGKVCTLHPCHRCFILTTLTLPINPISAVATTASFPWRHIVDSLVVLITMSIVSAQTDIIVVDSATTLLSLFDNLISLAVDPPSLSILPRCRSSLAVPRLGKS
jgi:hypothetical protein